MKSKFHENSRLAESSRLIFSDFLNKILYFQQIFTSFSTGFVRLMSDIAKDASEEFLVSFLELYNNDNFEIYIGQKTGLR